MPSANWTVPDSSPWIKYTGPWYDSDMGTEYYNNETFHFTNSSSASASVQFNGTGVTLYGAKRANHGLFTVNLDGQLTAINGSGPLTVDNNFNVSLFHQDGLDPSKQHSLTVSNGDQYVDIDWLEIEVGYGKVNTLSHDIWIDDSSANVTYEGWTTGAGSITTYYFQETYHVTNTLDAKSTISFYGNAIALYGVVSNNHGNYSVSLDGADPTTYSGTEATFRPQMLLWMANNLPSGPHHVVLSNAGSGPNGYLDFDYAIVTVWPESATGSNSSLPALGPGSNSTDTTPHKSYTGAIAGGVAGSIGGLLLLLGLSYWLWRLRRHSRGREEESKIDMEDDGTAQDTPTITPFVVPLMPSPAAHPLLPHPASAHPSMHPQEPLAGPAQDMLPLNYDHVFGTEAPTGSAASSSPASRPRAPPPLREKGSSSSPFS